MAEAPPCVDRQRPIGIIGLGLMGTAIAHRLHQAGLAVVGVDTEPAAADRFQQSGFGQTATLESLLSQANTVLLCLPSETELARLLEQGLGRLATGSWVIDTTTISPQAARQAAAILHQRGIGYVETAVSGSSQQLLDGHGLGLVGAPPEALPQLGPLIEMIVPRWLHAGPVGSGAELKLVTNLVLGLNRAALAEGLRLADTFGLPPQQALTALQQSAAYSAIMDTKGEKMINRQFAPQARLRQHLKDVELMLDQADRADARLPLTQVHRQLLTEAVQRGLGDLDNSAIVEVLWDRPPPQPD
jgi:3-hydroxyisobutyrate dehydrogenase-like beta-hydroxyacid dehydrogenase